MLESLSRVRIKEAYEFYLKVIYNKEVQELLSEHNLPVTGSVSPIYWELFGAMLTGDRGKDGYGADLQNHEVKSSVDGASFEYQYHLNSGEAKIAEDSLINHIFISYSPNYENLDVRLVKGHQLAQTFDGWKEGLLKNYNGDNRKQRYRKSIAFGRVKTMGTIIMQVRKGILQ